MPVDRIQLQDYFPYLLGTIANRWTGSSSRLYRERFGIGIGEWRVLASIHSLGKASSQEVVNIISMDASAVSRSTAKLRADGHVKPLKGKFAGRTQPYELTAKGLALHARVAQTALRREDVLLSDLSHEERSELLRLMRKVTGSLKDL